MQTTSTTYDAIVAGAGPTGLFLACELALAGCTVLVLERAADPQSPLKTLPFGIRGLNAPTIDALHRRGLLDELEVPRRLHNPFATQHPARKPAGHFAGIAFHEDDIDRASWQWRTKHAPPASLLSELAELETVFAERAEALGVRILRGHAVDAIEQHADGVTVRANGTAFEARWLVGCDGARSVVRKDCGIAFDGTEPEFTGYTARLTLTDPDALPFGRHATARGMYFQSQPGYFGIQDFDGGAFHDSGKTVTREHLQDVMRRVCGKDVTIAELHFVTTWTDRARQAATYRNGRVLLAGDAAHIHSPLGGQGLNLGIGDAMNLGWKLAATIRGDAPAGLLDTYEAERHPVAAQVLDWSRAQVALMRPRPGERALYAILRDLVNTRDGSTYVAGRVWGVNLRYELGDAHPLVGRSVPEVGLDDGTTVGMAMRDGCAVLVDFGMDEASSALTGRYPCLRYARAHPEAGIDVRALLVRPDGIVVWAGGAVSLEDAAARWFTAR